MKKAINLAVIEKKRLLLVKKKDVWILPGGKPKKEDKSYFDTLFREFSEELPGTGIFVGRYYGKFSDKTPHSHKDLTAKVYFGKVENLGYSSAEISDRKYISDFENYTLSKITEKIVESLKKDNYL